MKYGRSIVGLCAAAAVIAMASAEAQRGGGGGGGGGRPFGTSAFGDAVVQYDPETGTLMVITDEATNSQLGKIIENLDKPVPQVLIKILFLEVTHSDDLDVGIESFFTDTDTDLLGNVSRTESGGTNFGVAALAAQNGGAFYSVLKDDLSLTIRAMSDVGNLEVLSRPSILARNNEEAIITIGQEVPFIRNSQITSTGQTINTVEYEDIGIILQVTPHITPEGLVEMIVASEISTLTGESIAISDVVQAPVFAKRSAETRVVIPDGQTAVIGGLMEDNITETVRKVPILGDIPLLGMAFRRKIESKTKTELLIFLTPHVVRGATDLGNMTQVEHGKAGIANKVFTGEQIEKFIGNTNAKTPSE